MSKFSRFSYKTDLYIPIEIKARELDAALLVAHSSRDSQFRVIIGSRVAVHKHIVKRRDRNAVLLYKSDHFLKFKLRYLCYVSHFAVLDQEMGPVIRDIDRETRERISPQLVSRYFTLGQRSQEAGAKLLGAVSVMTGWPRFELLDLARSGAFQFAADEAIKFKPFIIFVSNVSESEFLINQLQELPLALGGLNLIVRPHPSESVTVLQRKFEGNPSIHVSGEGSALSWCLHAEGVIHTGSTVGLEAKYLGVTTAAVVPDRESANTFQPELNCSGDNPFNGTATFTKVKDAAAYILQTNSDQNQQLESSDFKTSLVHHPLIGSSKRILESLGDLEFDHGPVIRLSRTQDLIPIVSYSGFRGSIASQLLRIFRRLRRNHLTNHQAKMRGPLSRNDLEKSLRSFSQSEPISIEILDDELFTLTWDLRRAET